MGEEKTICQREQGDWRNIAQDAEDFDSLLSFKVLEDLAASLERNSALFLMGGESSQFHTFRVFIDFCELVMELDLKWHCQVNEASHVTLFQNATWFSCLRLVSRMAFGCLTR